MAIRRLAVLVLVACSACASWAQTSLRELPYDDPIYSFLEKAYARGWVGYLPQIRPYSEAQALELVDEAGGYLLAHPGKGTPLADQQIEELRARLSGPGRHLLGFQWGQDSAASIDVPLTVDANDRLNDPTDAFVRLAPGLDLRASMAKRLYLSLDMQYGGSLVTWVTPPFGKFDFPQREDYPVYELLLSQGTSAFHLTDQLKALHQPGAADLFFWMNMTSQNTVDFSLGTLTLGRGALDWGPSPLANLALSRTAKPYDYLELRVPLGVQASFVWTTGFLQDFTGSYIKDYVDKILNAHRFEMQPTSWLALSVYESIIYSRRLEISYLNPLSIYAVAEVSRGDWDNKLGGADVVLRFPPFKVYGSLFIDDWDFGHLFDINYYHNEWAGIAGVEAFDLVPNLGLTLEYIHLSHWMYTHRGDFTDAVNNLNRYVHFDSHLGHFLNPNSHMVYLNATYDVSTALRLGMSSFFTQNGGGGFTDSAGNAYDRGNINSPPDWSAEATLPGWPENVFLDGIVESTFDWTIRAEYRIPAMRLAFDGSYSLEYTRNVGKIDGVSRWDHILSVEARWMVD